MAPFDQVLECGETIMTTGKNTLGDTRSEYGAALQGAAFRYVAMTEAETRMATGISGIRGPLFEMSQVNAELANFIFSARATCECALYATFALGAHYFPTSFPFASPADRRAVSPVSCSAAYQKATPSSGLAKYLDATLGHPKFKDLGLARILLFHRASAGMDVGKDGAPGAQRYIRLIPRDIASGVFNDDLAAGGLADRHAYVDQWLADLFPHMVDLIRSRGGSCP
ncbi:MAG: hypothetical protein ACYDDF_05355 [Thermoplasmatota archaeon]